MENVSQDIFANINVGNILDCLGAIGNNKHPWNIMKHDISTSKTQNKHISHVPVP